MRTRKSRLYVGRIPLAAITGAVFFFIVGALWLARRHTHDATSYAMMAVLVLLSSALLWVLFTQLVRLDESRENLRLTLESSTDIVMLLDAKTRYLELFAAENLVSDRDQLIGRTVRAARGDAMGEQVEKLVAEVLATGEQRTLSYSLIINGETRWFDAVTSKRDDETVVVMSRDVTKQRALSQQLEDQRLFMEQILNTIPDPIFLKDEKHRWLYGNDAFCALLGKNRSEFYGKRDSDFFPPEISGPFYESDRQTFSSMVEIEREEVIPDSQLGGEERTILTKKTPLIARDGTKTLVGIIRDITDRKMMERQLAEQRARQVAASRLASLGEMAGGVAHEINNPLAIISGYTERLRSVLEHDSSEKARALDIVTRIETTATRIASIIKGLRSIARDGGSDSKELVSVDTIVNETLGLCAERFISGGVTIETKLEPDLQVYCRPVQISQVLLNLLTNAYYAVSQKLDGSISVEANRRDSFIEIGVTDSGDGIEKANREKIFEPFFTTKPVGAGTGLGLSIGASIVRDHGGELILDTTATKTRFVVRLPVVQSQPSI